MPTNALCFLVWNERPGCEIDLPQIDFSGFDNVYAIDENSTDGTAEVLERFGVRVYPQQQPGLNAAYWEAVERCPCDNLVVFFPKGTLAPAILPEIRKRLLAGYDLVVPGRCMPGGRNEEHNKLFRPRTWGIQVLSMTASLLWRREGTRIRDVLHGVKGFSKKAFLRMNPTRTGVSIDLEMVARAYRLRISRCEFPVCETPRTYGETKFKILPTGIKLARYLLRELARPGRNGA